MKGNIRCGGDRQVGVLGDGVDTPGDGVVVLGDGADALGDGVVDLGWVVLGADPSSESFCLLLESVGEINWIPLHCLVRGRIA